MSADIHLPTLGLVLGSAAIDSINPCAIGVLILMISVMMGGKKSLGRMLLLGGLYIFAIFITYLLAGLGILYFLASIPLFVTEYLSIFVGVLIVLFGLVEIKDYFWYGRGFSLGIPVYFAEKINNLAKNISVPGVMLTGVFVAGVELPCTGAPYLAIITILSVNFNLLAFLLLVLYNIVFVLPLVAILLLVAGGVNLHAVKKWKQESRGIMRLAIGLLLIGLGWLLILIANGTINFG
ncbi:MAG: cytochrome c bioproteinis transmembrane protein [Microgenomates group bacterium Gr01-1014_80]|nr:MAG: cytochrome c bioproteinis transmembrane protein [Microgenomates group bacterium Gr01-1014_80]